MSEIGGVWRTIGGRRVFIKDGQGLKEAMIESRKFSKKQVENENNKIKAKEYKTLEEQIEYIKHDEEKLLKAIDESNNSEEKEYVKYYKRDRALMKNLNY